MGKACGLATVTTREFIPGTMVMIRSFLKNNPWFEGDIIIIHDRLDEACQDYLKCFKNLKFLQISPYLGKKLSGLIQTFPELKGRTARFYSLEALRLSQYEKILLCDSDLLFLRDIRQLFRIEAHLACCGDQYFYRGMARDPVTFLGVDLPETDAPSGLIRHTFNSGLLLIDRVCLSDTYYTGITGLLDKELWSGIKTHHTDQVLFNIYFKDKEVHILPGCYNYLVAHRALMSGVKDISGDEIKVLHFNGRAKPWFLLEAMDKVSRDPSVIAYHKAWLETYMGFLPEFHFRCRLQG